MISWRLHIVRLFLFLLPETRCFGLKTILFSWCGADIGNNVKICSSVRILGTGSLSIGDDSWIGPQCLLVTSSRIKIGAHVNIAPGVYIGTGTHEIDSEGPAAAGRGISADIVVEDGVWLGVRSVVTAGVHIGSKSVVGAGAVVIRNIEPQSIVGGVPAKRIGHV